MSWLLVFVWLARGLCGRNETIRMLYLRHQKDCGHQQDRSRTDREQVSKGLQRHRAYGQVKKGLFQMVTWPEGEHGALDLNVVAKGWV